MHPAQIKAALAVAGYKQVDLAREFALEPGTISAIINGRSRSKQVEDRIAEITRLSLLDLWPQWYGESELVLSPAERDLVLTYRELSSAGRINLIENAKTLAGGHTLRGQHVSADRGSIASGGDMHIGTSSSRRKK